MQTEERIPMPILDKSQCAEKLREYYESRYGKQNTDVWYEQPAVNVWVFGRDNQIITLKSDVITGNVTETVETKRV